MTDRAGNATPLPSATRLLILSWLAPQVLLLFGGRGLDAWLTQTFALVPAHVSAALFGGAPIWPLITFATSTFLHAGWLHFGSNALFMLMIAPPLERVLGGRLFLGIYGLTSLAAGLAQWAADSGSFIAIVGASGGISGLFGVFAVMFSRRSLPDRVLLGRRISGSTLHVLWQLAAWIGLQALTAFAFNTESGGFAVWAHIGGFVVGLLCGVLLKRRVINQTWRG